jgi:hypothetical protein
MPNIFALTLKAQNSYPGNSVIPSATQQVPDVIVREESLISGVFEAYGTGQVNTLTLSGTTINSVLNNASPVALTNPITNATLAFTNFLGLYVTVTRRDPTVAPASTITTPIAATLALTPSAGSKVFVVAAGLAAIVVNMRVRITSTTSPNEYVEGIATVYSGTNLTVVVDKFAGSTLTTNWTITGVICAQVSSTDFGGITFTTVPLRENAAFAFSSPTAIKAITGNNLSVFLNGTTGLNVNVLVTGS